MDARSVVRADALFEALLGLALLIGAAGGALDAADFPHPVGSAIVVIAGALLLGVAVVIWRGVPIKALAAGNVATAALAVVWLAAASGFSTAGTVVLVVTAGALVALAAAQVAALR
jgi:hypothetical protein